MAKWLLGKGEFLTSLSLSLPLHYENAVNCGMKFLSPIKENPVIENQVKR